MLREAGGVDRDRVLGLGDDRDRVRARAAAPRRSRRALRRPARGDVRRARRVPASAQRDRRGRDRRRRRRRPGRRARADRRPLDQGGAPARRRGRRLLADRRPSRPSRAARPRRARARGTAQRARQEAARGRARRADLVGPGRRRRRAHRGARSRARLRRASPVAARSTFPRTANARGVAAAWAAAADADEANPEPIELLLVSGDEAAADPSVRALAEQAERVIVADDVPRARRRLGRPRSSRRPAALERDGTTMNLEGRVQRLRRAVPPPVPGRARLDREARRALRRRRSRRTQPASSPSSQQNALPRPPARRARPARAASRAVSRTKRPRRPPPPRRRLGRVSETTSCGALRLHRYRPLFSGPAVERVPELEFQRPEPTSSSSAADAERRGIATGDTVLVRSNGTSVELRARVNRKLVEGVARDRRRARRRPAPVRRGGEGT